MLETPYGALSAITCWDADYPDVVSQVPGERVMAKTGPEFTQSQSEVTAWPARPR